MAIATVTTTIEKLDSLTEKVGQASAIADLIRHCAPDMLAPDTLDLAGGVLDSILREVDVWVGALRSAAESKDNR